LCLTIIKLGKCILKPKMCWHHCWVLVI
jgi:hypothetical protein